MKPTFAARQLASAASGRRVISSPPTSFPCFYGIATPSRDQLLASRFDPDQMARHIGADSLGFVSIDGLYRAMGDSGRDPMAPRFCDACFTGDYPIRPADADEGKVSVQLSLLTEPA